MCELCLRAKSSAAYRALLDKMGQSDLSRIEASKAAAQSFSSFTVQLYSTIDYKVLVQPMFEPKLPFSTPINYFQNLLLNNEKLPGNFSHGSTRSIFFLGNRLIVLSKSTSMHEGSEFFSSLLLAHFEPSEYNLQIDAGGTIIISAECEKPARNLLNGKAERIHISFSFSQQNLEGKLLSKDMALSSTLFTDQFKRAGINPRSWLTSTEYMFDYVSSVAHFSPHPYMLQCMADFGFSNQKEFQNSAASYFGAHLKP